MASIKALYGETFGGMGPEEVANLLREWEDEGGCPAACSEECWVEVDGMCEHGRPSWLIVLGFL